MSPCLSDRTLFLVHEGDASETDRAHVRACLGCAARHQRLVRDLQVIGDALRGAPPLFAVVPRRRILRRPAAAVAAVVVALVVFGGIEAWMWRESVSWVRPRPKGGDADPLPFLEKVSAVLSSTDDASGAAIAMLVPVPDFTDVTGVPEVEWRDEWE